MSDEWDLSDDDIDELMAAWDAVDREAATYLKEHLPDTGGTPELELARGTRGLREGVAGGVPPYDYFVHALEWSSGVPDESHRGLWLTALASTIAPPNDPQTDVELQSAVMALQHADWIGIVTGLVRRGVGAQLATAPAQDDIAALEGIDGDIEDPAGHRSVLDTALLALSPLWQALAVLDDEERLTPLGRWGVPRALHRVWAEGELDDEQP